MSRFENFTPPTLGSELSTSEITMLEELTALANSGTGEFIRKSAGSLVNATLSETIALSGLSDVAISNPTDGQVLTYDGSGWVNEDAAAGGGSGTVTTVSVVTANGVSGTVVNATTTPAITLTLGAIVPTTVNGLTITANGTNTLNIAAGKTLTVSNTLTLTATDGSTLAIGTGGTLGSAAYTASTAYAAALGADDNYVTDAEKTALHATGSDDTFTVANEATDTTCFPLFVTAATGDLGPKTVATLTFNSNTGSLGATTFVGALTGNASGTAATVTGAAQAAITSLGTLTTLTVDDIMINGNTISSAGASTLAITPTVGQSITFDGTVTLDAGVIAGATSITSTTFVGALTGSASGSAATVTGAAQAAITSLGTLTNLDVDNININLNTISSTAGTDLLITPLAGQQIVLDGTIIIDAGEVTGATSITSTTFVGALTGTASGNLTSGGALGTPSSGTLTNCTGLPVAGLVALTASEMVGTNASGFLTSLAVATYPSLTELTYVKGVTSALQTQLGLKAPLASPTFTGTVTIPTPFTIGAVSMTATGTELNYVVGVTSAIQTQFTSKAATDQTFYIGTTQVAINRASAALTLAGITLTTPDIGTPSAGVATNITGVPAANILAGSFGAGAYVISTSLQAATIELGHATDTTLSRVSAGVVAIEGVNILTTAGGTLTGNITLGEGADPATIGIVVDNTLSADERYSGITTPGTAGATIAFGDICYLDVTAAEWLLADASVVGTAGNVPLGICVDASADGAATSMLLMGTVRSAAFPASIALGAPVYISETAGDITATAPVTADSVMRRVGWAVTVEPNTIYFNPSNDYITHT